MVRATLVDHGQDLHWYHCAVSLCLASLRMAGEADLAGDEVHGRNGVLQCVAKAGACTSDALDG